MSSSNTICAVTAAVETGIVGAVEPVTEIRIDTAVDTRHRSGEVRGAKVVGVTVVNVPGFAMALDHPLHGPELGTLTVDGVFGVQPGQWTRPGPRRRGPPGLCPPSPDGRGSPVTRNG